MTPSTKRRGILHLATGSLLAMALAGAAGCAHQPTGRVLASGRTALQPRILNGFTGLQIGPGFVVEVITGEPFAVTVRADESFQPYVETVVESGTLVVRMNERVGGRPRTPLAVSIRAPSVDEIEVADSQMTVTGLSGPSMRVTARHSRLRADGVKGAELFLTVEDHSNVHITGAVEKLRAQVSGGSQVEARQLQAVSAIVDVAPGARLELSNVGKDGRVSLAANRATLHTGK